VFGFIKTFGVSKCPLYFALSYTWDCPTEKDGGIREDESQCLLIAERTAPSSDHRRKCKSVLDDLEFNKPALQKEMRKISLKRNLSDLLGTVNDERLIYQDIRPPDKFYI
jgi:hypothetical protein